MTGRNAGRRRLLVLIVAAVAGLVLVTVAVAQDAFLYYRTPSELATNGCERCRVSGTVVDGTLQRSAAGVEFTLSDGYSSLRVVSSVLPPGTFREGEGAVVEGALRPDQVFEADQVLLKHSNVYEPLES